MITLQKYPLTQFKFIVEDHAALPTDPKFWDYLFSSAQKDWEMFAYEQDWLFVQVELTNALQVSILFNFN